MPQQHRTHETYERPSPDLGVPEPDRKREELAALQAVRGGSLRAGASASGVVALQRLAGNAATAGLVSAQRPAPVVQRDGLDDADSGMNTFSGITSNMGNATSIGTTSWLQNASLSNNTTQTLGNADNSMVTSSLALPGALWSAGRSYQKASDKSANLGKAKAITKGGAGLVRARERQANSAQMDAAGNTLQAGSSITNVVSGGIGVSSALNSTSTALNAASNAAGVAGNVVALPLSLFNLYRTSRRADLQRQRMNRAENVQNAMQAMQQSEKDEIDPEKISASNIASKDKYDQLADASKRQAESAANRKTLLEQKKSDAETALRANQEKLATLDKQIASSKAELTKAETKLAYRQQVDRAHGRTGAESPQLARQKAALAALDQQRTALSKDIEKNTADVTQATEAIQLAAGEIATHQAHQREHEEKARVHGEASSKQQELGKKTGEESKFLNAQGQTDTSMPTLEAIAKYATEKNARGFKRRALGAGAAALGVAGGTIGLAGAIKSFQAGSAGSAVGNDLGVAAAVIGGAAALVGIGVGIWKAVSFVQKRKAQAAKMAAAADAKNKANANTPGYKQEEAPSFWQTYNPFRKTVDQTTERTRMATALYFYATEGTELQRQKAQSIMTALDPSGPWSKQSQVPDPKHPGKTISTYDAIEKPEDPTDPTKTADLQKAHKEELISHFADKMGSGG